MFEQLLLSTLLQVISSMFEQLLLLLQNMEEITCSKVDSSNCSNMEEITCSKVDSSNCSKHGGNHL